MSVNACRRIERFNAENGVSGYMSAKGPTGANLHPDRCACQGNETTPHKHYPDHPHSCARCVACKAYEPAIPNLAEHAPSGQRVIYGDALENIELIFGGDMSDVRPRA